MSPSETFSPDPTKLGRVRRSKACKHCHGLKVRCTPVNESDPSSPCVRCVNSNKVCEMDLDQPRKRKKRGPNKEATTILELKEQVRQLQAQILAQQHGVGATPASATMAAAGGEPSTSGGAGPGSNGAAAATFAGGTAGPSPRAPSMSPVASSASGRDLQSPLFVSKRDLESEIALLCEDHIVLKDITDEIKRNADKRQRMLRGNKPVDVVSLGVVSMAEAKVRLQVYRQHLYAAHPLVTVPDDATVELMIATQPFMFNTIMSISCMGMQGNVDTEVSLALENHAVGSVVMEIMVAGAKTVELLKCLILLSLWYNSPELFKLRRYHILNNVAVTLLHDLGIVKRSSFSYSDNKKVIQKSDGQYRSLEYRTLIMILYFSTVNICLILRRAVFVKWTPYVNECCELLEKYGSDPWKNLAVFSRLNHQLERIHHIIHSPDSFDKPHVPKYVRSEFQTHLAAIKTKLNPNHHQNNAYYYSVEAYLFQPNFVNFNVSRPGMDRCSENLSIDTLIDVARCTTSCLHALDEFSMLLSPEVGALPLFYSSRVIYTAGMLLRLRYLILSLPSHIEKELVPRYAIFAIQKLSKQVITASQMFPANYFLKKMTLILRLFIQTYVTQVLELLRHNETLSQFQETGHLPKIYKDDIKHMINLATVFSKLGAEDNVGSPFCKAYPPAPYLDMLSSLASSFRKPKNAEDDESRLQASGDPESSSPEEDARSALPTRDGTPETVKRSQTASLQPSIALHQPSIDPADNVGGVLPVSMDGCPVARDPPGNPLPHALHSITDNGNVYQQPPILQVDGSLLHSSNTILDMPPDSGDIFIDDEFWSNLLSTDSNAASHKFHFAQDEPMKTENLLFMN